MSDGYGSDDPRCSNCGSAEVRSKAPMPGDYAGEVLEMECGACGYPLGVAQ